MSDPEIVKLTKEEFANLMRLSKMPAVEQIRHAINLIESLQDVIERIAAEESAVKARYIAAARKLYEREGELEFDDDPVVSLGSDPGAYVQCWRWVSDSDLDEESD